MHYWNVVQLHDCSWGANTRSCVSERNSYSLLCHSQVHTDVYAMNYSDIYVTARFATQPVSKPTGRLPSGPAGFETGWRASKRASRLRNGPAGFETGQSPSPSFKDNGPSFETGWLDGFESGSVDTNEVITNWPTYFPIRRWFEEMAPKLANSWLPG